MAKDSLRTQFAREVAARWAFDSAFADLFSIRDTDDRRVVVPVLDTDPVQLAVKLIQQAGREGTLAVLNQRKRSDEPSVVLLRLGIAATSVQSDWDLPVSPDCTIADLLRVLLPGASLTMRMVDGDELRIAELAESAGLALR